MKKVLFVATVASHIKAFHEPYLKLFKDNGYKTYVVANNNLSHDEEICYCDEFISISIERSPYKFANIKAIRQLRKIINKEKFDIIHCHTPMGSVVTRLAAKTARKKYGTKVIYTAHGFHFYKGAPKKNWLIFYPVEKYLAKYTDMIITINKEDYDLAKRKFSKRCKNIKYFEGVGIKKEKLNFIMSENDKDILRKSLGLKNSDYILIYPAELSKRKGQIWLINAISKLLQNNSDIHLLLPGRDSLNGVCQKLVDDLNLKNQIHFLGYRNDIPCLLKISNASLSTSYQEGLPVNIMEAMSVGLPVIVTSCRGNSDLVENGENGFIIDRNSENSSNIFVEKILEIKNNPNLEKKIKKNNLAKVKMFNVENILKKYEQIVLKNKEL